MMTPQQDPNDPYPGVGSAFLLTFMALVASFFTTVALFGVGALAAYGVGRAIGVGAVASMAAQRVGEPQAARLGLRRLDAEAIPLILCLVPAVLLASELDNFAYDFAGDEPSLMAPLEAAREEAERAAGQMPDAMGDSGGVEVDPYDLPDTGGYDELPDTVDPEGDAVDAPGAESPERLLDLREPSTLVQAFIVMVGIIPIVDCFLFFGVIQQGLVRRMGLVRGVLLAGLFWMLLRDVPIVGWTRFLVGSAALLGMGGLLGLVRIATGSILGPMILASGWAAIEFVSLATHERMDLPGLNVEGTHLPLLVSLASALIVGWAAWTIYGEAERRTEPEAEGPRPPRTGPPNVYELRPPPRPPDDDEDGPTTPTA